MHATGTYAYFLNLGNEARQTQRQDPLVPRFFLSVYKRIQGKNPKNGLDRIFRSLIYRLSMLLLYLWIAARFDVIVLKSGQDISSDRIGVKFLKALGKTIIFTYHGSDSRPFYLNGSNARFISEEFISEKLDELQRMEQKLAADMQLADYIIDSPTSAHFQKCKCCLRQVIFNPAPVAAFAGKQVSRKENQVLKILHAPSDPLLKGTNRIRRAINKLKEKGYEFEYKEIVAVPNEVVIKEILSAHIIVDELYSDNYGGILALEGVTATKVVIVGGYAQDDLDHFVPEWARMPTFYCNPDALTEVIERVLTRSDIRDSYRERARNYINNVAAPEKIAERLTILASGNAPESWFFSPEDIRYAGGATAPLSEVKTLIGHIVSEHGEEALHLDDKPDTRSALLRLIAYGPDTSERHNQC